MVTGHEHVSTLIYLDFDWEMSWNLMDIYIICMERIDGYNMIQSM